MTLNITVLSPAAIHQSADFCISDLDRADDGDWTTISQNQSKVVSLVYRNWSGLLTYCGIGSWKGRRTDEYVAEWTTGLTPESTFHEFLEQIRSNGSEWIGAISSVRPRPEPHSFVIAVFIETSCQYAIISNYQSLSGKTAPARSLIVDSRPTDSIHVLVTGLDDAVSREDRRLLKRLAADERNLTVIRDHMAEVNARAAGSPRAKKGISEACVVYSTARSGTVHGEVHGVPSGPIAPRSISGVASTERLMDQMFRKLGLSRGTLVQTASGNSRSIANEANETIDCQPRFLSGFDCREEAPIADLKEIGDLNQIYIDLRSINKNGDVVGNASTIPGQASRAFVWNESAALSELTFLGDAHGYACDINDDREVVGDINVGNGDMHAFYWTQGKGLVDLGSLGRKASRALCVSACHAVVGYLRGDRPERAFIWRPGTAITELFPETDGWLRAIQITAGGSIIGWSGKASCDRGYIWTPADGMTELLTHEGRPFYICAINENGVAVGEADDSLGVRRPTMWTRRDGLITLQVAHQFHPIDIDSWGNIVGNVSGNRVPLSRPYIYTARGEFLPLPCVEEHDTYAAAMNDNGVVIGSARYHSLKHTHSLVWHLRNIPDLRT